MYLSDKMLYVYCLFVETDRQCRYELWQGATFYFTCYFWSIILIELFVRCTSNNFEVHLQIKYILHTSSFGCIIKIHFIIIYYPVLRLWFLI